MPLISVIIPVYNASKYIEKCLNSIAKQKNKNIEIIIVNDGSKDESESIIKQWIKNNDNLQIIYLKKENGGLSDARNYGLKYVNGDYISFIDSDDYITDNLYKDLDVYLKNDYDMIKFKILNVDEDGKLLSENKTTLFEEKNGEEAFNTLCYTDNLLDVAWGYIYKTKFWKKNNFEYAKGLFHEDFGLTSLIMLKAKKVASTNIRGYNYVQTQNSMVRDSNKNAFVRAKDLLKHYDYMLETIKQYNISKNTEENIKKYYTNSIILATNSLNHEDKIKYLKEIKKRKMWKNIKAKNAKQLFKKILLKISIKLYLKMRRDI